MKIENMGGLDVLRDNQIWADWLVALGTILTVIAALFGKTIRGWMFHPRLQIGIRDEEPDRCVMPLVNAQGVVTENTAVFYRVRVTNRGNVHAQGVRVLANTLERQSEAKKWEAVSDFVPVELLWSHSGGVEKPVIPSHNCHGFCELGHVLNRYRWTEGEFEEALPPGSAFGNDELILVLATAITPSNFYNYLGHGIYRLSLLVYAQNAKPKSECFEIENFGLYTPDGQSRWPNSRDRPLHITRVRC